MCEGDHIYKPISLHMLDAKYKIGSYWILIDSVSNIFDSTFVYSTKESDIYDGCLTTYQAYDYSLSSVPNFENNSYRIVTGQLFKNSNGPNTGTLIFSPYYYQTSDYQIVYVDSFFVFDRYYHQLSQTTVFEDPTHNDNKVIYYMNTDFGLLRKDIFDTNLNLISKRILVRKNIVR